MVVMEVVVGVVVGDGAGFGPIFGMREIGKYRGGVCA